MRRSPVGHQRSIRSAMENNIKKLPASGQFFETSNLLRCAHESAVEN